MDNIPQNRGSFFPALISARNKIARCYPKGAFFIDLGAFLTEAAKFSITIA